MNFSAAQIAELVKGHVIGNTDKMVNNFGRIEDASENDITFYADDRYLQHLKTSKAGIVLISEKFSHPLKANQTFIKVEDAHAALVQLLKFYDQASKSKPFKISDSASIANDSNIADEVYIDDFVAIKENAIIDKNVQIHMHVSIGKNVTIGEGSIIHSGVRIYDNCQIGKNCIIHSNTVIGSDGFGFVPTPDGSLDKVPQLGNVIIEDDVEIGACCTIDCATMGSTLIKSGVKLDNQIQVAHNVTIRENTVIAAQTGIAGSTTIGKNCMIGGQVGFAGHIIIGDQNQIAAQSGINSNTPKGSKLYGSPAFNIHDFRKSFVYFRKLPQWITRIEQLEKKIKQ